MVLCDVSKIEMGVESGLVGAMFVRKTNLSMSLIWAAPKKKIFM